MQNTIYIVKIKIDSKIVKIINKGIFYFNQSISLMYLIFQ